MIDGETAYLKIWKVIQLIRGRMIIDQAQTIEFSSDNFDLDQETSRNIVHLLIKDGSIKLISEKQEDSPFGVIYRHKIEIYVSVFDKYVDSLKLKLENKNHNKELAYDKPILKGNLLYIGNQFIKFRTNSYEHIIIKLLLEKTLVTTQEVVDKKDPFGKELDKPKSVYDAHNRVNEKITEKFGIERFCICENDNLQIVPNLIFR